MMIDREVATDPSNDIIRAHQGVRSRLTYRKNINRQPRQTIEKRLLLPWEKRKNVFFFLFFFFSLGWVVLDSFCAVQDRGEEKKKVPLFFFSFFVFLFLVFFWLFYMQEAVMSSRKQITQSNKQSTRSLKQTESNFNGNTGTMKKALE